MDAPSLNLAHWIQGTRIMRFQEVYEGWRERPQQLGDKRRSQVSKRKARVGEIDAVIALF